MKFYKSVVIVICLFLLGCQSKVSTYSFSYTDSTRFSPEEKVILESIIFTEISDSVSLDLPTFYLEGETEKYVLNYPLTLAQDLGTGIVYNIDEQTRNKLSINKVLLDTTIFGEVIPWSEADQIFPRYNKALVRDLETGNYFRVQRRGGSSHVDAQPLTKQDTESMYNSFGGDGWSWDRRAVIVKSGDTYIAASMNGMPHGAGAISDNDFDGHFCIHFSGSVTHGNNNLDFAHQLMIKKAGGLFFDTLMDMPPEDILKAFVYLSTQEQVHHLQYILRDTNDDMSMFSEMQSISLGPITRVLDQEDYVKLEVDALYYLDNARYEEKLTFDFFKEPWDLTWKIKFTK